MKITVLEGEKKDQEHSNMEIHVQAQQEATPPAPSPAIDTPPATSKKNSPHVCPYCQNSFRRDEHLQRHIRTHTGEKKYQCPCKMAFARNDVFVRHLRICQPELGDKFRCSASKSRSRPKTKRACDECAKVKAKCDHQIPCSRCRRRSIKCEKTRQGYEDPYAIYSLSNTNTSTTPPAPPKIESEEPSDSGIRGETQNSFNMHGPDDMIDFDPAAVSKADLDTLQVSEISPSAGGDMRRPPTEPDNSRYHHNENAGNLPTPELTLTDESSDEFFLEHPGMLANLDLVATNGCGFAMDTDPVALHLASMGNLELLLNPAAQYQPMQEFDFFSFPQFATPHINDSFSLSRLDPLETKCNDIIDLLRQTRAHESDQALYSHITRQNIVHLSHLYGKHFHQNMALIHSPTFDLIKSPPHLVLAIMLVGACYSPDTIPSSVVVKISMRLLTAISLDSYEADMKCPSLDLIQAGVLLCCVLSCSKDMGALRSVRINAARNISMCERAGLLDPIEPVDYSLLTEETFDWPLWIRQESQKRIACEIFCQDMVHCIFLGRTPDFDPRCFDVELPTYEAIWEAGSASECLHLLQTMPQPIRVSDAMTTLMSWPDPDTPLFEASAFGMFVLINAMHFLLHKAIQADKETSTFIPYTADVETVNAIKLLKNDPSGPNITAIADRALKMHASPVIRRVDNALNAWRTTWDLRSNRDSQQENRTFKGDPLPFWWLAKLYLLLHYHSHILQPDSEFATSRAEAPDTYGKSMVQRKIIGWLGSFRGKKVEIASQTENWLPDLMKLTQQESS